MGGEESGTGPALHRDAVAPLQDHAVDAAVQQQVPQHEPCRAGAEDHYTDLCCCHAPPLELPSVQKVSYQPNHQHKPQKRTNYP
ncbi:hypothetical protein GCM10011578_014280 [Streptomyces fuscichromogenes]|uniref:Uncharacterized protein n=1 Tax=Streptomyces fuscichromogenes TaxID=1324013 RepID=A0A917X882_9ACTN|nr:hypothetical protein GCM10011578_014280 [Streptomyces fuscichromogenes]